MPTRDSIVMRYGTINYDLTKYDLTTEFNALPGTPNLYEIYFSYSRMDTGLFPLYFFDSNQINPKKWDRFFVTKVAGNSKKWKFTFNNSFGAIGTATIKWILTKKGQKGKYPQSQYIPYENYVIFNGIDSLSRIDNITFDKGLLTVNDYDFFYMHTNRLDAVKQQISNSLYENTSDPSKWSLDIWGDFNPTYGPYVVSYCLVRKSLFSSAMKLL